ncbi:hypothetical protein FG386_002048 [Cryptosporidium ryanae]|uniref:uncharacterized protein n=1 Tax=Cryptosporidium ryanae TaxID=515981 RepID=UPI00351A9591|nr:hypothetical protein FG386_002048 [Cryptosporidium ryanae]
MEEEDWESLILKRAIERNSPTLADLLEIYESCKLQSIVINFIIAVLNNNKKYNCLARNLSFFVKLTHKITCLLDNKLKNELRIRTCEHAVHNKETTTQTRDTNHMDAEGECIKNNEKHNISGKHGLSRSLYHNQGDSDINPEPSFTSKKLLESKLLQLQQELTNSYRNKSNFDNSINSLKERIEQLEAELAEKETLIRSLEKRVAK